MLADEYEKKFRSKKHRRFLSRLLILIALLLAACLGIPKILQKLGFTDTRKVASLEHGWNLILVNGDFKVPDDLPLDLVEIRGGEQVDERILPDLNRMFEAMRAEGLDPIVASGYRTAAVQQSFMEEKTESLIAEGYSEEEAEEEAKNWVARVGSSEHQTGLAIDINDASGVVGGDWPIYNWLAVHARDYGFIYRYREEKKERTGFSCEPWHYRYVGPEAAKEIEERGLCLEEYLDELG